MTKEQEVQIWNECTAYLLQRSDVLMSDIARWTGHETPGTLINSVVKVFDGTIDQDVYEDSYVCWWCIVRGVDGGYLIFNTASFDVYGDDESTTSLGDIEIPPFVTLEESISVVKEYIEG